MMVARAVCLLPRIMAVAMLVRTLAAGEARGEGRGGRDLPS